MKFLTPFLLLSLFMPNYVGAQGYEPPPLFAPQKEVPKRAVPDVPVIPRLSKPAEAFDELDERPKEMLIKKRVFEQAKDQDQADPPEFKENTKQPSESIGNKIKEPSVVDKVQTPKPPIKPAHKIKKEAKPLVKKNTAPLRSSLKNLTVKETIVNNEPVTKKKTSQGVVKGPRTMPSVKKQDVDTEVTFSPEGADIVQETAPILDRLSKAGTKLKKDNSFELASLPEMSESDLAFLPKFSSDGKLLLLFNQKQQGLEALQTDTLNGVVLPKMIQNPASRIMITAFAAPQEGKLNEDRKLALSRALFVREHLLSKGVTSDKIDIRSLGSQTDIQPMDRVEIILTP